MVYVEELAALAEEDYDKVRAAVDRARSANAPTVQTLQFRQAPGARDTTGGCASTDR